MAELESFIDRNFHEADIILLTGDFNVWGDLPNARHSKKLINLMNAYGLFQLVREPTHIAGHTLDHVYANPFQLQLKVSVLSDKYDISPDHLPILIEAPLSARFSHSQKTSEFRNIKNIDIGTFKTDLQNIVANIDVRANNNIPGKL